MDMDFTEVYVTRPDIQQFPFPYKLWIVVNLEMYDFVSWNRDGTVLLLDLVPLEDYLNSTLSIFKIKNRSVFLEHLEQFQFERLNAKPEAEEDLLLQYRNENFQRHRLDLLAKIRRHTYHILGETNNQQRNAEAAASQLRHDQLRNRVSERDLCFMSHGALSNIQRNRIRLQTILNFQNETRILQDKLRASDGAIAARKAQQGRQKTDVPTRAGAPPIAEEEQQVIELPVELFENPHDSVLNLGPAPEYAGYYGNCSKEQIMRFFGDYLPMYENGTVEVKKIAADSCATAASNQNFTYSDLEQTSESLQPNDGGIQVTSTQIQPLMPPLKPMPPLDFSSGLEPIFKADEDDFLQSDYNFMASSTKDIEPQISMEEFITFNDADTVNTEMSNNFPQMPTAVKMEIAEENDSENEANFRNFFSQYRASLNLLYDKQ